MKLTEEVVYEAIVAVLGTPVVKYREWSINFSPPWRRITLHDALREFGGEDPEKLTDDEIKQRLREMQVPLKVYNRGVALVKLFEKLVEKKLVEPTFVLDYPEESTPLCKPHREKKGLVERFEAFVGGLEIANAYTELNDPVKQYEYFVREEELFPKDEAHPLDWDFVEELSFGMYNLARAVDSAFLYDFGASGRGPLNYAYVGHLFRKLR